MRVGVTLPMAAIGADIAAVRDFVQAAEALGYSHLHIIDHLIGAEAEHHPEVVPLWYTHKDPMREPFTLMSYLAAITETLELVTEILVLPQRQTALVAKQAAEVDVLTGGRLRLGVGLGWNPVESEAMGYDFRTRGRRIEEQIDVLRALWTQEVVNFKGREHRITYAGINPLPVQRPIPIWIGAGGGDHPTPPDVALRRIGRMADGWFLLFPPDEAGREVISRVNNYAREAGRDPSTIGIEGRFWMSGKGPGRLPKSGTTPEDWLDERKAWEDLGATHLTVLTSGAGFSSLQEHIEAIRRYSEVVEG